MDELLKQAHAERAAWQALTPEEQEKLPCTYTWWEAPDFFAGARMLHDALRKTGGDMKKCKVTEWPGCREVDGEMRRVQWNFAVNEAGEEIAAFDITWNCPPRCE